MRHQALLLLVLVLPLAAACATEEPTIQGAIPQVDTATPDTSAEQDDATPTNAPPAPTDVPPTPTSAPQPVASNCLAAYPDICLPPPPPDLDCGDISERRFRVLAPDPHNFDSDLDGIGCETG